MSKDAREAFHAWIKAAPEGWEMLASPSRLMAFEAGWNARDGQSPKDGWVLVPSDDPNLSCADSLIPDEMVIAGIDAYEAAHAQFANGNAGKPTGWDVGMIVIEVYRAMVAARPKLPVTASK